MVLKSSLNVQLNLSKLVYCLRDAKYNPKRFSAIIWKHKAIQNSCLLFTNGKIVLQGATSYASGRKKIRQYARLIQKLGYAVQLDRVEIVTITGLGDIGRRVDLSYMCRHLENCVYEPELFNALVVKKDAISYSVFSSGKIVIAGVRKSVHISDKVDPFIIELALL